MLLWIITNLLIYSFYDMYLFFSRQQIQDVFNKERFSRHGRSSEFQEMKQQQRKRLKMHRVHQWNID
jgi:hypothetical protein